MANSAQARKRARQAETRRQRNASQRTKLRTHIKRVRYAIAEGDADTARTALVAALPVIDRAASKSLIHAKAAARYKSRLNHQVKALSTAAASA